MHRDCASRSICRFGYRGSRGSLKFVKSFTDELLSHLILVAANFAYAIRQGVGIASEWLNSNG
jgi:hypothetical protein